MANDEVRVLLVGLDPDLTSALARQDGIAVESIPDAAMLTSAGGFDAVVGRPASGAAVTMVEAIRAALPAAAIVVVTLPGGSADGAAAVAAGADDHLDGQDLAPGLLWMAIKYSIRARQLRGNLSTKDTDTGLPNMEGFRSLAEHHLQMAARDSTQVVFVFVRFDGLKNSPAGSVARDAAAVLLEAVRDADVLARISPDTFCVLLSGATGGVETMVLSRLVESIAMHDARSTGPRSLSLSVGSAAYDPQDPRPLDEILLAAEAQLSVGIAGTR